MARKTASRKELRKQVEAAEAAEAKAPKKKKKATRKKATRKKRTKKEAVERRKLMWGVFSASMKEEGRYPYFERKEADKKIEQLRAKSSKLYFIQAVKEVITEPLPTPEDEE